jgi:N-glycosylase/DNA lyase
LQALGSKMHQKKTVTFCIKTVHYCVRTVSGPSGIFMAFSAATKSA